jgi:hypothetical protein
LLRKASLKNIFYKKQQVEIIDWSQANYHRQFDGYFENIKNWYFEITQDVDLPQNHLIDFGQLQDIDFLKDLDSILSIESINYEKIADYYAHSSKEMQHFMERSALVIIDFEKAIEYGYIKLCDEIRTQYLEEYGE